ncbi:MAG: YigZ family protein [Muribaculaceae bacterium]|nr:YigZ family protein [Muribaculaceae bacterium]
MADSFFTIEKEGKAIFKEKMSKFISFAVKVTSPEEAKAVVKKIQNEYHDARHVCWAYMIGPDRNDWQLNDNGEPSGTAGKPILGQINSFNLTDVMVVVVRYFGGIKLGTSGLIAAYREAARLALEDAGILEMHKMETINFSFPYMVANDVMKLVKSEELEVINRNFDNACEMTVTFREDNAPRIKERLKKIEGLSFF